MRHVAKMLCLRKIIWAVFCIFILIFIPVAKVSATGISACDSENIYRGSVWYNGCSLVNCSGGGSDTTGVVWPFATKSESQYNRVDQGWDIQSTPTAAIYAIAPGKIHVFNPDSGGFGNDYPTEELDSSIGGDTTWVYYGHVHVLDSVKDQHVNAGQQIAVANTTDPENGSAAPPGWLEIGFAQSGTDAPVASGYEGGATEPGQHMKDILINAPAPGAASGTATSTCCLGGSSLPTYISEPWNSAFTAGGNAYKVAPALIAAIFSAENSPFAGSDPSKLSDLWVSYHHDPDSGWPTSSAGAMGPFQFLKGTWEGLGYDIKDINTLTIAADAASKYLASNGGTADKPPSQWHDAIFLYNHAEWYVNEVLSFYSFYADGGSSGGTQCGGGISPDGFVFPQVTNKAQLAAQKPYTWNPDCVNPVSEMGPNPPDPSHPERRSDLCHHDYLAADIFNDTGVAVVSPRPGKVVSYHDGGDVGWSVRIYSDPAVGGDGLWYYMCHMLTPSEGGRLWVSVGDTVKAGQQVGQVGTNTDAQGTQHHTHIDVSPVDNGFHRGYDGTAGPLLDPQPALKAAYENLP